MSVGFGFYGGDFIAAINLVGTVIDALSESSKSSSELRELLGQLYSLETALREVKLLEIDESLHAEHAALRQSAAQCQRTITDFLNRISGYQRHLLRNNGTVEERWKKGIRRIMAINAQVVHIVLNLQNLLPSIPGQVERQQPVYLNDALRRYSPFHLEFINSPEALLGVLSDNLKKARPYFKADPRWPNHHARRCLQALH
ncbi:MAG: hypothetical protein Q9183_004682 [Haloplaca sp. 2 TL-2023]